MTSTSRILSRILTPRDQQKRLAEFIDGAASPAIAVQADTGTGKTAVLLSAAIAEAKRGRRAIVSTHTIQLLHQVEREAARFSTEGVSFGTRLGMRNFISVSRANSAFARLLSRDDATAEDEAVFSDLMNFAESRSGLIEDFVAECGDLPAGLKPHEICLLPSARASDRAAWQRATEAVRETEIVIQTHALTLAQARFGQLPPVVIFDEADALSDVADSAEDNRLSLAELQALLKYAGVSTAALDRVTAEPRDFKLREDLAATLKIKHEDEDVRFAMSNAQRILTAHKRDGPRRGTDVIREGNDTIIRALWADRAHWIWRNLTDAGAQRSIFASATLAVGDQVGLSLRRYGVPLASTEAASFSPRNFGTMDFRVIPETTPAPVQDRTVNDAWREEASLWLTREGLMRKDSRPLVLAQSYADTAYFAERLGIIGHERGQPLARFVERFRSGDIQGLATPAGWAGIDLPGLITDVVVLRLPYGVIDDLKTELTGRTDFPAIKAAMQRKLKQGLGRGIRKEDDQVTVWLADPRVHDLRNGILAAIPERFRNAFLVSLNQVRMRLAAVRTEQERFRDALLAHHGGRCVVTGSNVEAVLEAAHRPGKSWKAGHNRVEDGLLVRSDIHKLIDDGLLTITDNVVSVDPSVAAEYGQYEGKVIAT
ncbi:hypothetical protein G5V57_23220 [Nordella sp. HKS 07]|uniref:DEAD/DEAH box helicase n=1 Tax=Nordella sp. HKS 07 TaxID=2712222 RepID=UPI0013E16AF2|nr:DEAD/DEAH box helicase [Nordella sp. HKS 07]QIG50383.1 hypothetical protein G5V57_23220 [Nordella sp. HKS 07]